VVQELRFVQWSVAIKTSAVTQERNHRLQNDVNLKSVHDGLQAHGKSAQSPVVTVKDSGQLIANLLMESQVPDVTRELSLRLQKTVTSDRALIG